MDKHKAWATTIEKGKLQQYSASTLIGKPKLVAGL